MSKITQDASTSWWVEDFAGRLAGEQARMRREILPSAVDDYFTDQLNREEEEILLRRAKKRGPIRGE